MKVAFRASFSLLARLAIVSSLALAGCARRDRAASDPPAQIPDDRFPGLTGAWTGGADDTPYGPARATLFVGPEGWGTVNVLVQGKVVSRPFHLLAWDGRRAELDSDGSRHLLGLRLDEDRLLVEVPGVGQVALARAGRR